MGNILSNIKKAISAIFTNRRIRNIEDTLNFEIKKRKELEIEVKNIKEQDSDNNERQ